MKLSKSAMIAISIVGSAAAIGAGYLGYGWWKKKSKNGPDIKVRLVPGATTDDDNFDFEWDGQKSTYSRWEPGKKMPNPVSKYGSVWNLEVDTNDETGKVTFVMKNDKGFNKIVYENAIDINSLNRTLN